MTGATGTVGRQVVQQLVRAGQQVRALTRNPAAANLPAEVEVLAGDLAVPQTVAPALADVTGMHLISFAGEGYAPLETAPEIVDLAAKAGVRRVTVLTGYQEGPVERAVEAGGFEWTHVQPVEFMANALGWAESIRSEGVVREGFPNLPSAKVHEADIAAVAVTALLEDGHAGRSYPLTGPEALTVVDTVRTIGAAIGRDLRLIELTEAQVRDQFRAAGQPDELIESLIGFSRNPPAEVHTVLPTVEEVTGRPARTFAQWAAENAEAFR
nr:Oxidoreductase [Kibdelosporangium sp. MJ126-NF4]CTQ94402.1 Oxidoreductase [Kibdelosporangium sp. MJ126-NF4]